MKSQLTGNRIRNLNLRNRSKKLKELQEKEKEMKENQNSNKCPARVDNNKIYRDWIKKARNLPKYKDMKYHDFLKASREEYYEYKEALEQ